MKNEKRRSAPKLTVGITSIVVIFAVLCLSIFSVLSLSTAASEKKLALRYAQSVTDYYTADSDCADTANAFAGLDAAGAAVKAAELGLDCREEDGAAVISWSVPAGASLVLSAQLRVDAAGMRITRWQLVESGGWTPDEGENVWDGEEIN